MEIYKKFLSVIISCQLLLVSSPVVSATAMPNAIVKLIKREMEMNQSFYYPERFVEIEEKTAGDEIRQSNSEVMDVLRDESFSLEEVKQRLISQVIEQEAEQRVELQYVLGRMDSSAMDSLFNEAMERGQYPQYLRDRYQFAYNSREKSDVLLQMIAGDLADVKTTTVKRIGMASRQNLMDELNLTNSFFVVKGEKWKTIAIIALSVAVAGFATWGIVSALKSSYAKKTEEMHDDYDNQEQSTEAEYARKEQELLAQQSERNRLRDEGYVWAVCKTETRNKTASCLYDHSSHSGSETCITRCLKNPTTGDETQQTVSCTSAFIPNNCFLQNRYDQGHDAGFDDGYDHGYDYSYQRAYDQAYREYYDRAYSSAYTRGYDYGYSEGYSDGLAQAVYDNSELDGDTCTGDCGKSAKSDDELAAAYKKGYHEGYTLASMALLGLL